MLDNLRFGQTWRPLTGAAPPDGLFAAIDRAYGTPDRAYHNAAHIVDCLTQLDTCRHLAERADEIEMALWFHDAIYDPHAADNEERSAAWASSALAEGGAGEGAVTRVAALIMATKHVHAPRTMDESLLIDIDLSILGREPDVFDVYDENIRREYAWVLEETYRLERGKILRRFLARRRLFGTDFFCERYETQARRNLERALERLDVSDAG